MWAEKDSNLRSRKTADLQSAPVGRLGICPEIHKMKNCTDFTEMVRYGEAFLILLHTRATCRNRTSDLLITNQLLYQLS